MSPPPRAAGESVGAGPPTWGVLCPGRGSEHPLPCIPQQPSLWGRAAGIVSRAYFSRVVMASPLFQTGREPREVRRGPVSQESSGLRPWDQEGIAKPEFTAEHGAAVNQLSRWRRPDPPGRRGEGGALCALHAAAALRACGVVFQV